jgi:oligopeptide/dipeptide ABC transporter ATP-binding protein
VDVVATDVFTASPEALGRLRRGHLGYIFQNPIGTLDPTRKVSRQFFGTDGRPISEARIANVLEQVRLDDIPRVLKSYPHELSGGMAQRVAIAMAIEHEPRLIIADEPTSALDASVRLQILDLLKEISIRSGAALIIVSHDLKAVRSYCERVAVMYAGRIVELGDSKDVFAEPSHPYTAALIRAMPGEEGIDGEIRGIRGNPPLVTKRLEACAFAERCDYVLDECWHLRPEPTLQNNRWVSCHLASRGISARAAEG